VERKRPRLGRTVLARLCVCPLSPLQPSGANPRIGSYEAPGQGWVEPATAVWFEGWPVEGQTTEIRVMLVDDHAIERQGVRSLLEAQPDIQVVAEAGDGLDAIPLVGSCHPDVVITETIMPRMNGLELTGQLLRRYHDLKVLVLTRNDREDCVLRLVQAGAGGYLLKTVDTADLIAAIRAVMNGGRVLQPTALEAVLDDYLQRVREPTAHRYAAELTAREREVLKLIAEGNTNQDIAELLCLSRKTVETHRSNIMDKLDLHKVTDLVKYAIREGLVGLD
jgi:DNA-binding NarL/FixJ family response regulator